MATRTFEYIGETMRGALGVGMGNTKTVLFLWLPLSGALQTRTFASTVETAIWLAADLAFVVGDMTVGTVWRWPQFHWIVGYGSSERWNGLPANGKLWLWCVER